MVNFTEVKPLRYWVQHILPLVYDDSLSYMELLAKVINTLNEVVKNNNLLPDYIAENIKEYISSGEIEKVLAEVLANYMLNVKFPPAGLTPATGDGSADDTEAIQGCIDYAYNHGGMSVYFPSGSYLTQPLTLRNKATLFGQDRYTTRLVMKGGSTKAMFTGDVDELTLTGLGFDGNMDIQVNNVNLFTISVNSAIITNCLLTDGYDLLNITVNNDLQLNNVIFKHAVENALVLNGDGFVQGDNLIFKTVSALVGKNFVVVNVSNSILEQLKCHGASPNAVLINGNNNVVKMWNDQSTKAYTDNGTNNTIVVYTQSEQKKLTGFKTTNVRGSLTETVGGDKTETITGNKDVSVHDLTETAGGNKTETITGNKDVNVHDLTETVGGNKTETITGNKDISVHDLTETVAGNHTKTVTGDISKRARNFKAVIQIAYELTANRLVEQLTSKEVNATNSTENLGNKTENIANEKHVIAGSVTENITGDKHVNAANSVETIQGDKTVTANNSAETITGDTIYKGNTIKLTANKATIDIESALIDSYLSIKNVIYNALEIGCKNDGITDNFDILNNFFTSYEGDIYFPAGNYVINGFLTVNRPIKIYGDKAILLPNKTLGNDLTPIITFNDDSFVTGVTINGKLLPSNNWGVTDKNELKLISGFIFKKNAVCINCNFANFWGDAIFIDGSENALIDRCYFNMGGKFPINNTNDHFGDAIYIRGTSKNVFIKNCSLDMLYNDTTNSRAGIVIEYTKNTVLLKIESTEIKHSNRGIHAEECEKNVIFINNCIFKSNDAQIFNWANNNITTLECVNTIFEPTLKDYNGQFGLYDMKVNLQNCHFGATKTFFNTLNGVILNSTIDVDENTFNSCSLSIIKCYLNTDGIYRDFNWASDLILENCLIDSKETKYINNTRIIQCYSCTVNNNYFSHIIAHDSTLNAKTDDDIYYSEGSHTFKIVHNNKTYLPNLLFSMPYNDLYTAYDAIFLDITNGPASFKNNLVTQKDSKYVCIVVGCEVPYLRYRSTRGARYFTVTTDSDNNITGSEAKLDIRGAFFDIAVDGVNFTVEKIQYANYAFVFLLPFSYLNDSGLI